MGTPSHCRRPRRVKVDTYQVLHEDLSMLNLYDVEKMNTTLPIPSTIPNDMDWFTTADGRDVQLSLSYSMKDEAIDHKAYLSGEQVIEHDVMAIIPDELTSFVVLHQDDEDLLWAVDEAEAKEIAEEAFEEFHQNYETTDTWNA